MYEWSTNGPTYLIVQADVHDLTLKVISTASAVLHAPVQVCLGALHCTFCVSDFSHITEIRLTLVRKLCEPCAVPITYSTTAYLPHLFDNILSACKLLTMTI